MKLAIVGSRTFNDYWVLISFIEYLVPIDVIISGGAKGADLLAKRYANQNKIDYTEFLPDWDKLGKAAGFIRNQQIVDVCDMVLAFWNGESKGTKHTIDLARKAKKPTFIVYF